MTELRKIGVLSAAKISGAVELVLGLAFAVLFLLAGGAMVAFLGPSLSFLVGLGLIALLVVPIAAFVAAFVGNGIAAFLYNVVASRIGGVIIEIRGKRLNRVGATSLAKFGLIAGALLGLVSGLAAVAIALAALPGASGAAVAAITVVITVVITTVICGVGAFLAALIYNAAASVIGGIVLDISDGRLKGVGIAPYAKMAGLFGLIEGIFIGVMYAALGSNPAAATALPSEAVALGAFSIVAFPIAYLVIGMVCAAFGAWLYNGFAKRIGGVVLELK